MNINKFIDNVIEQGKLNIKENEGDYTGENGLLYCGECNTPKQTIAEIPELGIKRVVMCLCKCGAAKRDAEEAERKRAEFERRIKELRTVGFSKSDMHNWTFANDDMENPTITKAMQKYVENFPELRKEGKGLLLHGNVGTGKTYAACEVANALIDKGYPVLVTNFARIINTLQGMFERQDYIDELNSFDLLVIDDLGIERDTPFAKEQVFNVIDSRYRAGLPMIITTNLTPDELKNPADTEGRRIYDRVLEKCFPIEVSGASRRRKAVRESYNDMKELLGL